MELILLVCLFAFGLAVGSFANVLIDRLPAGKSVVVGRSQCDYCRKTLRWYELIPVVSYVIQRGRCRRCQRNLSMQYPLVELATALGFVLIATSNLFPDTRNAVQGYVVLPIAGYWLPATGFRFLAILSLFFSFLILFGADLKYQILPDSMTILALISSALLHIASDSALQRFSLSMWLGYALSGGLSCAFFYAIWRLSRGRGMGFGDVKLSFVLGFLLGYPGIIVALYLAFLTGAVVGVILIIAGAKNLKSKIAFGPFLLLGAIGSFIWKAEIILWWQQFIGI